MEGGLPTAQQAPSITLEACTRVVEAATKVCAAPVPQAAPPPEPNWDAMANGFASLSTAFTWGSILLAVIAVLAALAWGKIVIVTAEREAKEEAKKCAEAYIKEWLSENAAGICRNHVEMILDATMGNGDDRAAADEIGKNA